LVYDLTSIGLFDDFERFELLKLRFYDTKIIDVELNKDSLNKKLKKLYNKTYNKILVFISLILLFFIIILSVINFLI